MKILFWGAGVIGAIYGYALEKAGFDVTHYVRSNKVKALESGIKMNLLDARNKKNTAHLSDVYSIKVTDHLDNLNNFDLIIVSVRFNQIEETLQLLASKPSKADILFFNNMWDGVELINKYISKEKYLLGFPYAGGSFQQSNSNLVDGVILDKIYLGEVDGQRTPRLKKIEEIFNKAKIKVDIQENIVHWLWVHFAVNAGISSTAVKAEGVSNFVQSIPSIKQGVLCVREALQICKRRGVNTSLFTDAKLFSMPSWIVAFGFWTMMKTDEPARRALELYKGADELKRIYFEVLKTGEKLKVDTSNLKSMKKYVEKAEKFIC
ncbi:MAG: ketopantoate reductase family protein [Ruminiclostridium sp.]